MKTIFNSFLSRTLFLGFTFVCNLSMAQNTNVWLPLGNIGIGTLTPAAKLEVKGSTLLQTLSVTGGAIFKDNLQIEKGLTVIGSTVTNALTVAGQFKLPQIPLVNTISETAQVLVRDAGNTEINGITFNQFVKRIYDLPCTPAVLPDGTIVPITPIWSNKPNVIYVNCPIDTRVGIGYSDPIAQLHVRGDGNMSALGLGILNPNDRKGLLHLKNIASPNNDGIIMLVENNERKLLQLNNQGLLQAREVKVNLRTWADYVFENGYKMYSLPELEKYVLENRHLPNIPSRETVLEEGMDVGQMSTLLLEKIEELTLYVIQQQKEIEALKLQLNKQ